MVKKSKISTPEWIIEGYDSKDSWEKEKGIKKDRNKLKTFKIKICPKCGSDNVKIILNNNKKESEIKQWRCNNCKWEGEAIKEKELTEDELIKYLDNKGENTW